ncbi:MAG TPA: hypothetical protein VFB38_09265 [Chthonomonadaceae bacterium]|nr:hypothetical protein [Chthonomonadaceae bacterium]
MRKERNKRIHPCEVGLEAWERRALRTCAPARGLYTARQLAVCLEAQRRVRYAHRQLHRRTAAGWDAPSLSEFARIPFLPRLEYRLYSLFAE